MKQTMDWIGGIAAQNKFVSGTGLPFEDARLVTNKNAKKVVTNGVRSRLREMFNLIAFEQVVRDKQVQIEVNRQYFDLYVFP
jgi:hypothetical protein